MTKKEAIALQAAVDQMRHSAAHTGPYVAYRLVKIMAITDKADFHTMAVHPCAY
jgi:hypothetical protein